MCVQIWNGYTPLMIASKKGHLLIVQELIMAGANVHAYITYETTESVWGQFMMDTSRVYVTSYCLAASVKSDNHQKICCALSAAGADSRQRKVKIS